MASNDHETAMELKNLITGDQEIDHMEVDEFVSKILEQLGFEETAIAYREVSEGFWYA